MPEGPSIVILKEATAAFAGQKVLEVGGNTKVDFSRLQGKKITAIRSFGKNFFICFGKKLSVKIHFMLFGSYRINERKETSARLSLVCSRGEMNFYACSVQLLEGNLDDLYDWSADVMSDTWDAASARKKLKAMPDTLVVDALLDQDVFAGVGNIIKNEVLYRIKVHPKNTIADLPAKKLKEMIDQARIYSFDFLEWKKQYVLKQHWLAHTKRVCSRDGDKIHKEYLGKTNRRTFYCDTCQQLYGE